MRNLQSERQFREHRVDLSGSPYGQACQSRRDDERRADSKRNKAYAIGLARAFGGAVIFAIPLLMTMEMWSLGFTMGRGRLLLFMTINFAILVGLSYFAGFEKTFSWKETRWTPLPPSGRRDHVGRHAGPLRGGDPRHDLV